MKKIFYLGILIVVSLLICVKAYASDGKSQWSNICPNSKAASYCDNVGKDAYEKDKKSPESKGMRLGTIIGVTWREKDTMIGFYGDKTKTSPQDAYYYTINDYLGDTFLRQCSEVEVK
jgi:hypothetical protein